MQFFSFLRIFISLKLLNVGIKLFWCLFITSLVFSIFARCSFINFWNRYFTCTCLPWTILLEVFPFYQPFQKKSFTLLILLVNCTSSSLLISVLTFYIPFTLLSLSLFASLSVILLTSKVFNFSLYFIFNMCTNKPIILITSHKFRYAFCLLFCSKYYCLYYLDQWVFRTVFLNLQSCGKVSSFHNWFSS